MSNEQLRELRIRIELTDDIDESDLEDGKEPPYFRPGIDAPEYQYMMDRRKALDGSLPARRVSVGQPLAMPDGSVYEEFKKGTGNQQASTTMAFVRLLRALSRDDAIGDRIVPIVPDEARTFGMDALFRELKIYAAYGQKYEPVDAGMLLSYRESRDGQILEEGITEAGSMCSFIAAGTAYADRGVPMVPFFIFYSMFGFQRVGDLIWQAADARSRGFLLGATAGRTTLAGEGLQHQDGHSPILAGTNPGVITYDPAFAYEMAAVVEHGLHRMYVDNEDIIFYLTLYNENYEQPPMRDGISQGIVDGMYRFSPAPDGKKHNAAILFSGTSHSAARWAQAELAERFDVGAELWSVTSYAKLRDEAISTDRWNRLHPSADPRTPMVADQLADVGGPVVAVTDYMRAVPDQIARWVPHPYTSLGTDGFGRSDTRDALRRFFEIDGPHVVVAVLAELARTGAIPPESVENAIDGYGIDRGAVAPWHIDD